MGLWDNFEERLSAARERPGGLSHDELESLAIAYRQVLHDHGLAASRFPGSGAARRLNTLALAGTHWLHVGSQDHLPGLRTFLEKTFPRSFRDHAPYLAAAAALFAVAFVFGWSLAIVEPGTGTALLGPGAVSEMRRGHLWTEALVTTIPPSVSSSGIATNNMTVAITGWAGGALLGLGALYVILFNGFLLGALLATTLHYGLFGALMEFVSAHGPLEITLILVTAAGGLSMGHALVAADDRPRSEVLRLAGRQAIVLLLGCLPWFVLLGVVEGFLSPSPLIPAGFKAALGLALLSVFLFVAWNPGLEEAGR
jgi:uncharacterized membrane protein SpoIIM required for sporulation